MLTRLWVVAFFCFAASQVIAGDSSALIAPLVGVGPTTYQYNYSTDVANRDCNVCNACFGPYYGTPVGNAPAQLPAGTYQISTVFSVLNQAAPLSRWIQINQFYVGLASNASCGDTTLGFSPLILGTSYTFGGTTTFSYSTYVYTSTVPFLPDISLNIHDMSHNHAYYGVAAVITATLLHK